jgi:hypothetical protein
MSYPSNTSTTREPEPHWLFEMANRTQSESGPCAGRRRRRGHELVGALWTERTRYTTRRSKQNHSRRGQLARERDDQAIQDMLHQIYKPHQPSRPQGGLKVGVCNCKAALGYLHGRTSHVHGERRATAIWRGRLRWGGGCSGPCLHRATCGMGEVGGGRVWAWDVGPPIRSITATRHVLGRHWVRHHHITKTAQERNLMESVYRVYHDKNSCNTR